MYVWVYTFALHTHKNNYVLKYILYGEWIIFYLWRNLQVIKENHTNAYHLIPSLIFFKLYEISNCINVLCIIYMFNTHISLILIIYFYLESWEWHLTAFSHTYYGGKNSSFQNLKFQEADLLKGVIAQLWNATQEGNIWHKSTWTDFTCTSNISMKHIFQLFFFSFKTARNNLSMEETILTVSTSLCTIFRS